MNLWGLVLVAVLLVLGAVLQIFLSLKCGRLAGLLLPALSLLYSLYCLTQIAVTDTSTAWEISLTIAGTLLFVNIPTFLYLAIYFVCRRTLKRNRQLEKMNIQDLN